jgi:hypothetical protein
MKIFYYLFFLSIFFTGCAINKKQPQPVLSPLQAHYPNLKTRELYVKNHPTLSPAIKQAIIEGKIIKGTTKSTIEDLFGPPETKHILESGLMEIWFYDNSHFAFVFDKNNKIIKIFPKISLDNKLSGKR